MVYLRPDRDDHAVRESLLEHCVDPEHIHLELFLGYDTDGVRGDHYTPASTMSFTLSGSQQTNELCQATRFSKPRSRHRHDTPYACIGGACGTCRAKLLEGTVEMDHNFALSQADLDAGYILTCQSHPTTPTVSIDYDA